MPPLSSHDRLAVLLFGADAQGRPRMKQTRSGLYDVYDTYVSSSLKDVPVTVRIRRGDRGAERLVAVASKHRPVTVEYARE